MSTPRWAATNLTTSPGRCQRLHRREWLSAVMESGPRTSCHLDFHPGDLFALRHGRRDRAHRLDLRGLGTLPVVPAVVPDALPVVPEAWSRLTLKLPQRGTSGQVMSTLSVRHTGTSTEAWAIEPRWSRRSSPRTRTDDRGTQYPLCHYESRADLKVDARPRENNI